MGSLLTGLAGLEDPKLKERERVMNRNLDLHLHAFDGFDSFFRCETKKSLTCSTETKDEMLGADGDMQMQE